MENYRTRVWTAAIGIIIALIWLTPNLVNLDKLWWFTKTKLNYGLDIQGGLHLEMGVDVQGVVRESTNRLSNELRAGLKAKNLTFEDVKPLKAEDGEIEITVSDKLGAGTDSAIQAIKAYLEENHGTSLQKLSETNHSIVYRFFDSYMNDYKKKILQQAIETIRNRIDEFGVSEPSISAQGADRILVQLPGVKDAESAKTLINTSAHLEFMMVDGSKAPAELEGFVAEAEKAGNYSLKTLRYTQYVTKLNEDLKSKIPEKTMVLFEKAENAASLEVAKIPYLVRLDTDLGGESISDATVGFGEYGDPEVSMKFNPAGAGKFADLTGANVGKRMAIVLDKVIKSAPNIQGRIPGGNARITLGGGNRNRDKTMEEAKMISMALRAGALPATLEQLAERRIGPSLGADSIRKAGLAGFLGSLIIFVFMLLRYRGSGMVANITLLLNVACSLALLSSFGATLTLPGIAGIALTVGFAVDSNVLIFERMREELRAGAGVKGAISEGYNRAMSAILDSNFTTAATAVVLYIFGTGPVKGFAVTLLIGIFTTIFCNVFISKLIMDTLIHKWGWKKISI